MNKAKMSSLGTEKINEKTKDLDKMNTLKLVETIVEEERQVVPAILSAKKEMVQAIDLYVETLKNGGRIVQVGSGCSGDYVQTDALELPATFGQSLNKVWSLHVQKGFFFDFEKPEEKAKWIDYLKQDRDVSEDSLKQPIKDLDYMKFNQQDTLIALTASGRTPYLVEIAKEAKRRGGKVISIVMNPNTEISHFSDVCIAASVSGPPIAGSGRMIAGTASKIAITTLSTAAHIKLGGVYSNLMVGLNVKDHLDNSKFVNRAARIVSTITNETDENSNKFLKAADWNIKVACVMMKRNLSKEEAIRLLKDNENNLRNIIG